MDWSCKVCKAFQIVGIDAPGWENASQQIITDHQALHAAQLTEHGGDHEALQTRLQHPALHAALNSRAADEIS